ncbi:hypothetical protein [Pantoea sp. RIT-PI-b]|uniref:hypothetical protein n=1 Tax=Pantoea sp. RIT-PI-b TaxID=1681195 RepID=UPI00067675C6|nr:hypothetical protein [Pantoea sp. RIT-PI-b]
MSNPWLSIPLADYEGHMALPDVGQADMLSGELETLLAEYSPKSVAIAGCAGGNGFDKVINAGVTRLVGVDINPEYIADARALYRSDCAAGTLCARYSNGHTRQRTCGSGLRCPAF